LSVSHPRVLPRSAGMRQRAQDTKRLLETIRALAPEQITGYAGCMARTGMISKPASWHDLLSKPRTNCRS
jgi:hypothetical protein